jgi:hypothetical protein
MNSGDNSLTVLVGAGSLVAPFLNSCTSKPRFAHYS